MPLMSRLSGWFERIFDMSEGEDVFEEEGAEGFLMTAGKEAPPILPQLRTGNVAPAEPPAFRVPPARPLVQEEPAVVEPPAFAAANEDDAPSVEEQVADEDDVEGALDPASVAVDQPDVFEEEPPSDDVQLVPAIAPVEAQAEPSAAPAGSTEDMLSMFRETSIDPQFAALSKDIEDVPATDLLRDAREVRDMLAAIKDNAA